MVLPQRDEGRLAHRRLSAALVVLGGGIAVAAIIGPLALSFLDYRTSDTTLHQIAGGDLAALCVVAPVCVVVSLLAWQGHRAAPVLALAPAVFALYTYAQLIVGNEYLSVPGNIEAFFPLLLSVFVTAGAVAVMAWNSAPAGDLPVVPRRLERAAAWSSSPSPCSSPSACTPGLTWTLSVAIRRVCSTSRALPRSGWSSSWTWGSSCRPR